MNTDMETAPDAAMDAAIGAESGDYGLPLHVALQRMRALAMVAAAADAELDAMEAGALDSGDGAETQALDRLVAAQDALVAAVRAADAGLALLADVEAGRATAGAAQDAAQDAAQAGEAGL